MCRFVNVVVESFNFFTMKVIIYIIYNLFLNQTYSSPNTLKKFLCWPTQRLLLHLKSNYNTAFHGEDQLQLICEFPYQQAPWFLQYFALASNIAEIHVPLSRLFQSRYWAGNCWKIILKTFNILPFSPQQRYEIIIYLFLL